MDSYRHLFTLYFEGKATAEEVRTLMEWVEDPANAALVKAEMDRLWETHESPDPVFSRTQRDRMLARILPEDEAGDRRAPAARKVRKIGYVLAAAGAVGMLVVGIRFYGRRSVRPLAPASSLSADIAPGGNRATLTLSNGKTILLDTIQKGGVLRDGKTFVTKSAPGQIRYLSAGPADRAPAEAYNTLATPAAGQYKVVLPDGSKAWLNSLSRLQFPTAFPGHSRTVTLSGEAYFEIAPDASRPFRILVAGPAGPSRVEVLGTRFDINAYADEPVLRTTLVDGAVAVRVSGHVQRLRPGQEASVGPSGAIRVSAGDPEKALAWKNGVFRFQEDDIGTVMRQLARWYNVEVAYRGPVPQGHYTGIVSRDTRLSEVLKVLALSGLHFSVEGRKIIVNP